jgi:O-antigen/teichoic acid export membrane protein
MTGVRTSLALSFGQEATTSVIGLASIMILARLLTPKDIGVFSIAAAVIALAHPLRDFGVGGYLIQEKDLTTERIQAAFAVTLLTSWLVAALIALGAVPIAHFYNEPGLTTVLWVLTLSLLAIPLAAPRLALLRRDMAFPALFRINVGAATVGPIVSVTTAASGFGPISLALGSVAVNVTTVALTFWNCPRRIPVGTGSQSWGRVFDFGIRSSATSLVTQMGMSAADLIIGRALGFTALGLYSRAIGLIRLFNQQVMGSVFSVALPAFAALIRTREDARAAYLRACSLITGIAWPFFAFLGLMAYPIVRAMFGDQWDEAVPPARILAAGGLVFHTLPLAGPVLLSVGRVDLMLRGEVMIQAGRILFIVLGALHSLEAVCVAQVGSFVLYVFIYCRGMLPLLDTSFGEVLRANLCSAVLTGLTMIGPVLVAFGLGLEPERPWLSLLMAAGLGAFGWVTGLFALRHPLKDELELGFIKACGLIHARRA